MNNSKYQILMSDVNRGAAFSNGHCVIDIRLLRQEEVVLNAFESGGANEQHAEELKMDKITFIRICDS